MKIIVAEKISASAVAQLQEPGWTVLTADQLDGKLAEHLESADALIVRSAVQADAKLLAHAKKLRVIGRAGVGVDNIDLEAATHKGIAVMNTPGANAVAVAEQTLGMMLAMARHLCRADALMHAGQVGEEISARNRASREDSGHHWAGQDWHGSSAPRARFRDGIGGPRSVRFGGGGKGARDPAGGARRSVCGRGLHHAACWTDSADARDDQRGVDREDEEGRAAGELCPRRTGESKPIWPQL